MTQRTVQFNMDFDVDGLSTIGQLEDELTNINDELKKVEINSDAFKDLSKQAALANGKLREIDTSLQGFTSDEKSDSVKKLSEGLVGGFAAASSAAVLFGDQTSEAMQKAIQKAGALFVAADGIDKMFKAMSKTNIAALKSTIAGFKKSAIAAKAFAKTTRGALAATGIGLLIIGIGLLIANFDKITEWVEKNFQPVIDAFQKFKDIITGIGGAIKAAFRGEDIKEAYNVAIEKQHELNILTEEYVRLTGDGKDNLDNQVELLKLIGASEEEILKIRKKNNIEIVRNLDAQEKLRKLSKEEIKQRRDANLEIQKIIIQEFKLAEQRKEAGKVADAKAIAAAKVSKQKAIDDAKELENQRERILNLRNEIEDSEMNLSLSNILFHLHEEIYQLSNNEAGERKNILISEEESLKIQENALKNSHVLLKLDELRNEIINDSTLTEKEREKRLHKINVSEEIYYSKLEYNIKNINKLLTDEEYERLRLNEIEKEFLINGKFKIKLKRDELSKSKTALFFAEHQLRLSKQGTDAYEEYLEIKKQIVLVDSELQENSIDELKYKKLITENIEKQIELEAEIVEIITTGGEIFKTQAQKRNEELDSLIEKYGFYYDAILQSAYNTSDIMSGIADRRQYELDAYLESQVEAYSLMQEMENQLGDERQDLNDLLKDAEGDRYNDILSQIQAIDEQEKINEETKKKLFAEEKKRFNAVEKAKHDAAVVQKSTDLVQAIIAGVLAVIKALPNIPLSIVTGILSAGGIAAIAAQPIPPKAKWTASFGEGGQTIGASHAAGGIDINAEGGEFYTNKAATRAFLPILEKINNAGKKMAEGGQVVGQENPALIAEQTDLFDYSKMAEAMAARPQFVSVVEFESVQNRLRVVEDRSSI